MIGKTKKKKVINGSGLHEKVMKPMLRLAETLCGFGDYGVHWGSCIMGCVTDNVTYSSSCCHHWDNLSQLSVLIYAHPRTETASLFPRRNPDIYKCQVTKISCHRSWKGVANTKMEKQLLLEFLPKMDKSERCSSSHISTSKFGCLSESFWQKSWMVYSCLI